MAVLEILLLLGFFAVIGVLGHRAIVEIGRSLERRAELKRLREERVARLEAAKTAKDIVDELMLDEEMAEEVRKELAEKLRRGE